MTPEKLRDLALTCMTDLKAQDVLVCDVRGKTSIADYFIIATGTSSRHARAIANEVAVGTRDAGCRPYSTEGLETSEWVLVDLGDVIVHVMQATAREFYDLEGLWNNTPVTADTADTPNTLA